MLIIITITAGVIWLVRTAIEHRRWQRAMRAQTELNTKLIDRFSSSEELLAYLQSPAGKALIEPAALPQASPRPMPMNAPLSRIFWSLQSGIVVGALGTGLIFVSRQCRDDARGRTDSLHGIGIVMLTDWRGLRHLRGRLLLPVAASRPCAVRCRPASAERRQGHDATSSVLRISIHGQPRSARARHPTRTARDATLQMDEETFRGFYTRTSGMLWAYLARATNDAAAADDLLQESYYRLLRATTTFESDDHRKNYLFRIATNLIRDRFRRPRIDNAQLPEHGEGDIPASGDLAQQTQQRSDLAARDGAAQPARARARVARVRAGLDASGDCRRARVENGQHQAAAVSRAPEAREDSGIMRLRDCQCDKPECPECGPLVALADQIRREFDAHQQQARVPTPEIVWWRAQMRAREEAARTAARPIVFTQALAVAALIGLLVSVVGRLTLPVMSWAGFPDTGGRAAHSADRDRRRLLADHCAGRAVFRVLARLSHGPAEAGHYLLARRTAI